MRSFNAVGREVEVYRNHLLEASAGTGKTYSIENVVVRLLIEGKGEDDPLTIDRILVVTFTRAATQELKTRVRGNIEKVVLFLGQWLANSELAERGWLEEAPPEYVLGIIERGEGEGRLAKKRLEVALFAFDEAQIFTIHSFCFRILREKAFEHEIGGDSWSEDNPMPMTRIFNVIKDFFRTELREGPYSPEQIRIVLRHHKNDADELVKALARIAMKGVDIEVAPDFERAFDFFRSKLRELKERYTWTSEGLIEDFISLASHHGGLCDRKNQLKPENLQDFSNFARIFDQNEWNQDLFDRLIGQGISVVNKIHPDNLRKSGKPPGDEELRFSEFFPVIREELLPLLETASSYLDILSRMGRDCSSLLQRVFREEEVFTPDDILKEMQKAVRSEDLVREVRKMYGAAIIDEFQDTDPIQWEIFRSLFISEDGSWAPLYLVGDPKQSIYGFRRADIYTYLDAVRCMGAGSLATLDTNYRSQAGLVEALNALFAPDVTPGLMMLPRTGEEIEVGPVNSSERVEKKLFSDDKGFVHFFVGEGKLDRGTRWPKELMQEELFFPFIAEGIQSLKKNDSMRYEQFAVLVRDRFEAERIQSYFNKWEIPSITRRSISLVDSSAFGSLREIIQAVICPSSHSDVAIALGGQIIGWTHDKLQDFHDGKNVEKVLTQFFFLRKRLLSFGFAHFFQDFMESCWESDGLSILEKLVSTKEGLDVYLDLQQLSELFTEHYKHEHFSVETMVAFFEDLKNMDINEDDRIKVRQRNDSDAVNILTIHVSKGLEFDVVFALGLAKRTSPKEDLVPSRRNDRDCLLVCDPESEPYKEYKSEQDAEKMRQLYVGMTRAKYRLYVPVAIDLANKPVVFGSASPVELFLARFSQEAVEEAQLYVRIENYSFEILLEKIRELPEGVQVSVSKLNDSNFHLIKEKADIHNIELLPPKKFKVPGEPLYIESFSSLMTFTEKKSRRVGAPTNWDEENKTIHNLPAGSDTGVKLHEIFEKLSFEKVSSLTGPDLLAPLIRPMLVGHEMMDWEQAISEMVFKVLKTALWTGKDSFCLADVSVENIFKEMEFLFASSVNSLREEGIQSSGGFVKGFIDLVFQHQTKYYILDWKSNWLGSTTDSYNAESLEEAMEEHQYLLQAKIYSSALRRYLKLVESRPFEECFGGVFYLFLRGVDMERGNLYGVYHCLSPERERVY
ncbi:MAG: exodeoxyribonuclease V beta subunit [Halioglobus sp.]|jgi:exodeoxyribonuclease V beta subunit